jgi:hypothetical protein
VRRRSRTRRVLKWAGTAGCALILVTWTVSLALRLEGAVGGERWMLGFALDRGAVGAGLDSALPKGVVPERPTVLGLRLLGWNVHAAFASWSRQFSLPKIQSRASPFPGASYTRAVVPLWVPFLVAALGTAIVWRRRRDPASPRCFRCGYNLTGNVSGRCPECGTPV